MTIKYCLMLISTVSFSVFSMEPENKITADFSSEEDPQNFAHHARSFAGTGIYCVESQGFIVDRLDRNGDWVGLTSNDFRVLFANWQHLDSKEYRVLKKIAEENYQNKKLTMNCWQFVLLIMLEQKMITVEDIETLYFHGDVGNLPAWVNDLWLSAADENTEPQLGDIGLFMKMERVAHVGIVTALNPLSITQIGSLISNPVSHVFIDRQGLSNQQFRRPARFISPDKAARALKALEKMSCCNNILAVSHLKASKGSFSNICKELLAEQISEEVDRRCRLWKETLSSPENFLATEADRATIRRIKAQLYFESASGETEQELILKKYFLIKIETIDNIIADIIGSYN